MTKRQRLNSPKKLVINSSNSGCAYQWRHPKDKGRLLTTSLDSWVEYAKLAEKGKLNALFIADHYTYFDTFQGPDNWRNPLKYGVNAPRIDPAAVIPTVTRETKSISVGVTFSTISEHPYHLARRLNTLDQFSGGRFGWNVVSSYLASTSNQLLNGEEFPEHDLRYAKTQEFVDVVVELLASSWRDDALVYDKSCGTYVDTDRVREIGYKGDFYKVLGPAISEPSFQRVPVLIQAGSSLKGKLLAAEMAEIVFVDGINTKKLENDVKFIRKVAQKIYSRDPGSIKIIIPVSPIVGKTHDEALEKFEELIKYTDEASFATRFGGISGIDLSEYDLDEFVKVTSNASKGMTESRVVKTKGGLKTKREILETYKVASRFVGTAGEIADVIEEYVEKYDIDGFNFGFGAVFPFDLESIVELLIPELQRRGLFWEDYAVPGGTFRENLRGLKGAHYLAKDHPYHGFIWQSGQSLKEFEQQFNRTHEDLLKKRKLAEDLATQENN